MKVKLCILGGAALFLAAIAFNHQGGELAVQPVSVAHAKPIRILPMTLAAAEIVMELVDRERIVAVPHMAANPSYSNIHDQLGDLPRVPTNIEKIISLRPDLILVASYTEHGFKAHLTAAKIRYHVLKDFNDVDSILESIHVLGGLVGEAEKAKRLVEKTRREIGEIQKAVPQDKENRVRILSYTVDGWTAGTDSTFDSLVRLAGGINVAAEQGLKGHGKISSEQVLVWKPDVIVVGRGKSSGLNFAEQLRSNPIYAPLLKETRIIEIDGAKLSAVSHYIVEGLRSLVEGVYQ